MTGRHTDAFGTDVGHGDLVLWSVGRSPEMVIGVVESFTDAGRIRIETLDSTLPHVTIKGEMHTVDPTRVVLIKRRRSR